MVVLPRKKQGNYYVKRRNFIPTSLFVIASICGHGMPVVAGLENGLVEEGCEYILVDLVPMEVCFVSPDDVVVTRVISGVISVVC